MLPRSPRSTLRQRLDIAHSPLVFLCGDQLKQLHGAVGKDHLHNFAEIKALVVKRHQRCQQDLPGRLREVALGTGCLRRQGQNRESELLQQRPPFVRIGRTVYLIKDIVDDGMLWIVRRKEDLLLSGDIF